MDNNIQHERISSRCRKERRVSYNTDFGKEREMEFELTEEEKKFIENIRRLVKLSDGITKLAKRTVLCNNWRRMHHLPLIRKNRWKKAMGKTSISWIKDLQKLGEEMH